MEQAPSDGDRVRFGIEGAWSQAYRHRVAWHEVDPFGHANHTAYLVWFETARNLYLEAAGMTLGFTTPGPVLANIGVRYLKPLAYGTELLVTARTLSLRRTSFTMEYGAWDGTCAAHGTALCVLMINATGERVPIPPHVRALMLERDGARLEVP